MARDGRWALGDWRVWVWRGTEPNGGEREDGFGQVGGLEAWVRLRRR